MFFSQVQGCKWASGLQESGVCFSRGQGWVGAHWRAEGALAPTLPGLGAGQDYSSFTGQAEAQRPDRQPRVPSVLDLSPPLHLGPGVRPGVEPFWFDFEI